ncbi:nitrite reductase small subunit NirD [Nocardioides marmoraquaticus]
MVSTGSTDETTSPVETRSPVEPVETTTWTEVCHLDRIDPESGVAALVDGRAVAVFRTHDDAVHALDNYDPFCRASVLARGIVGTRTIAGETVPYVASPMFKQGFDLRTGQCLDDADVRVATYAVEVTDAGVVRVAGTT